MTIKITSPETVDYNCIAWAASEDFRFWWPDKTMDFFWPEGVEREETVDAFVKAYATQGFKICEHEEFEKGFEKIALYAKDGKPQHAARQLARDVWSSKLGRSYDIIHPFIITWEDIVVNGNLFELAIYGELVKVFKKYIGKVSPKTPIGY